MRQQNTESNLRDNQREARLLFVVSEDWYFASHRLDLAKLALSRGWEVSVACRGSDAVGKIRSAGITFHDWAIPRGSINPLKYLVAAIKLRKHIQAIRPTHVHAVSIITVVIARGALIGRRSPALISTVAGLGRLSLGNRFSSSLTKKAVEWLGYWLTNSESFSLVAQNRQDFTVLGGEHNERIHLIPGSGVDPAVFPKTPPRNNKQLQIVLIARMLRDKGIAEFVRAIEMLKSEGLVVKGLLVGNPDIRNPRSFSQSDLEMLTDGSPVTWLGHREDIYELIAGSDVVCLPTYYGEGIPRVLLEAGCVGRPVVSCDVPGPRDLIRDGIDGFLARPGDSGDLAKALKNFSADRKLAARMGESLYTRVLSNYSNDTILSDYLKIYEEAEHPK